MKSGKSVSRRYLLTRCAMVAAGLVPALSGGAFAQPAKWPTSRSPALWPFSGASPWNTRINSGATYGAITWPANYMLEVAWQANTTSVVIAQVSDPTWTIYDNLNSDEAAPTNGCASPRSEEQCFSNYNWYKYLNPHAPEAIPAVPQTWCQPQTAADVTNFFAPTAWIIVDPVSPTGPSLSANYPTNSPFPYNPWSTVATPHGGIGVFQSDWDNIGLNYSPTMQMPGKPGNTTTSQYVCGSPDSDGWTSVIQPAASHLAVDLYAPMVVPSAIAPAGDGNVVLAHNIASYFDLTGDGTGLQNGRRASMVPTLAGLIRLGELDPNGPTGGVIPHALAGVWGPDMMASPPAAVPPAIAYDRSPSYTGNLPMGTLLAISPTSLQTLLPQLQTSAGKAIATAARTYGIYVVDTGSPGEINILAELNDADVNNICYVSIVTENECQADAQLIREYLSVVTNNYPVQPQWGGPGSPPNNVLPPPKFTY